MTLNRNENLPTLFQQHSFTGPIRDPTDIESNVHGIFLRGHINKFSEEGLENEDEHLQLFYSAYKHKFQKCNFFYFLKQYKN